MANLDKYPEEQRPLIISDVGVKLENFIENLLIKICEKVEIKPKLILKSEPFIPEKKEKREIYYLPNGLGEYIKDKNNPLFLRKLVEFMMPYAFDNGITKKQLIEKGFLPEIINRAEEKGLIQKTNYIEKKECRFNDVFTIVETGNKVILTNYDGIFHDPPEKGNPTLDKMIDECLTSVDIDMRIIGKLIIKAADGDKKSGLELSKMINNYVGIMEPTLEKKIGKKDKQEVKATFKMLNKETKGLHLTGSKLTLEKLFAMWRNDGRIGKKETTVLSDDLTNLTEDFAAQYGVGKITEAHGGANFKQIIVKDEQMAALRTFYPKITEIYSNKGGKQLTIALNEAYLSRNNKKNFPEKKVLAKNISRIIKQHNQVYKFSKLHLDIIDKAGKIILDSYKK